MTFFGCFDRTTDAVPGLIDLILEHDPTPRIIRIEGIDGIGKSTISKAIADKLKAQHIEADEGYRYNPGDWMNYIETVRFDSFRADVRNALDNGKWVVADSICLDEILPETSFGRGFRIYVMRLDEPYNGFWRWDYGEDLGRPAIGYNAIDLSVRNYHLSFKPHHRADAIVQVKAQGRWNSTD